MAKRKKSEMSEREEIHRLAIKRFDHVETVERDERQLAVEDSVFAQSQDGQWDEVALRTRRDRPRYTINRVAGAVDKVIGDYRQNKINIKVRPKDGDADERTAEIFNGIIRNIENASQADNAYDNGFDECVNGGFGGFRLLTDFSDDDSFEQDIMIKPIISSATSLWFDPQAKEYDKSDANWAFLTEDIPIDEYESRFPGEPVSDFDQIKLIAGSQQNWIRDNVVRIAEYWRKVPITKTIHLLDDGRVIDDEAFKKIGDELSSSGVEVVKSRKVKSHKVVMNMMSGAGLIGDEQEWAGCHIPLIPVFGRTITIGPKQYIRGLVRFAKDSQRIYNYTTSATVEAAALSPKDPYWITPKMAAGFEDQFSQFNVNNQPFMFFNPDDEMGNAAPQRTGAPQVQQALIAQTQQAAGDIEATTGFTGAIDPNIQSNMSGKAIVEQNRRGDLGTTVFFDNLAKSVQYLGVQLIDLIPKIYDTERVVRTLGVDGSTESVLINAAQFNEFNQSIIDQQTGEQVIVNNLSQGKYDVVVDTGPTLSTQKQEALDKLLELTQASPLFAQVTPDLIAQNLSMPNQDELVKRVRKALIQQGIVEPTEEEVKELGLDQPQQPDPQQIAIQQALEAQAFQAQAEGQSTLINAQVAQQKADNDTINALSTVNKDSASSGKTHMDMLKTQQEIGIPMSVDNVANNAALNESLLESSKAVINDLTRQEQNALLQSLLELNQQGIQ